jgi:hypothetical protein
MEINGQYLTEDDARELLNMLENHLMDNFAAKEEEVQHLLFEDAKSLFESRDNYPDKYLKLIDKLRKKHFQTIRKQYIW